MNSSTFLDVQNKLAISMHKYNELAIPWAEHILEISSKHGRIETMITS